MEECIRLRLSHGHHQHGHNDHLMGSAKLAYVHMAEKWWEKYAYLE